MTSLVNAIDETIKFNDETIRIVGTFENPLFVAVDICKILGLKNVTDTLKSLPDKWKKICDLENSDVTYRARKTQGLNCIKEAGLYKLIMRSNKPIAQKFQEVVCEEILPNLRKKGEYKIQSILDKNKELEDKLIEEKYIRKKLKAKYEHFLEKRIDIDKYKKGSLIYIIGFSEIPNDYKIGFASDLNKRILKFRTEFPYEPVVMHKRYFSLPDPIKIEKIIHYTLKKFRIRNGKEWFRTDDLFTLQTFIDQVDEVVSFFEMIFKKYENKKDIKYEQLKEYLKKEKDDIKENDNWDDFDEDDEDEEEEEEKEDEDEDEEKECVENEDNEDELENENKLEEDQKNIIVTNNLKKCYKCETYMNKSNFSKNPKKNDGLDGYCKSCKRDSYHQSKNNKKMQLKEKKCTKCNKIKSITKFYNRIGSIDGKTSECKDCTMVMYDNRKEKYETANIVIPENKKCHTCEITKEIKEFDKKKDSPDGHKIWCKKCCSDYAKNKRIVPKVAPSSKKCNECLKELSIDNFWNNKSNKDGKDNKCTTCHKKKRKPSS